MVKKGEYIKFASNISQEKDVEKGNLGLSTQMSIIVELSKKIVELEARIIKLEKQ